MTNTTLMMDSLPPFISDMMHSTASTIEKSTLSWTSEEISVACNPRCSISVT
jgi:hypothetical protein